MREAAAVSALSLTVTLVLIRPHIGTRIVVGPALAAAAGVLLMLLTGLVSAGDIGEAGRVLWRPLVAITSIMVTAAAAARLGVVDRLAAAVFPLAGDSAARLYLVVFALSATTATVLNNDSAVLLLTPLVVVLIRTLYPGRRSLLVPFVFAVFMAAGVAPLVTSNPMNLIVADFAGLDFNDYAVVMFPIALVGWIVTFAVLRLIFRRELSTAGPAPPLAVEAGREPWTRAQKQGLAVTLGVLGTYPIVSYFDGAVWLVAACGATAAVLVCWRHGAGTPEQLLRQGVSWEILAFLLGVFTLAIGLRNAGAVTFLTDLYTSSGLFGIGVISAVGSALINNHSMALTNLFAIEATPGADHEEYLAALIGGDLGPRLLPTGSLAGLLWFASLSRMGVDVSIRQFVTVGVLVTVPTLTISLAMLIAMG